MRGKIHYPAKWRINSFYAECGAHDPYTNDNKSEVTCLKCLNVLSLRSEAVHGNEMAQAVIFTRPLEWYHDKRRRVSHIAEVSASRAFPF